MATADSIRARSAQNETTTTGQRRAIRGSEHDVVTPLAGALGFAIENTPPPTLTSDAGLESVARLVQLRLALAGFCIVRDRSAAADVAAAVECLDAAIKAQECGDVAMYELVRRARALLGGAS